MKLSKLIIKNYRVFENETIEFDDYTCLVGPNGSGKSTILFALKIFFRDPEGFPTDVNNLKKEDFHNKNTDDPVEITAVFKDIGAEAQKELSDYYRQGELIVSATATYDKDSASAEVKQYGQRTGIELFRPFFEGEKKGTQVKDLKDIYNGFRRTFRDLPKPGTKPQMINNLRNFESGHPEHCSLIKSEDKFYGFMGTNKLTPYVQWIYIPAVKDVYTEQQEAKNTALGRLLERTVRAKVKFDEKVEAIRIKALKDYNLMLDAHRHSLESLSEALENRIQEWAHPGVNLQLNWFGDPKSSIRIGEPLAEVLVKEGIFEDRLERFGHGLQRSYLFALLHELSGCEEVDGPRMILGCEEPELYQHPPQLRHLAQVFKNLTQKNSQVILCTHSPYFVSGEGLENTRLIVKDNTNYNATAKHARFDDIGKLITDARGKERILSDNAVLLKINQALRPSIGEIFFTRIPILVEGYEDIAYITTYLHLMNKWDEYRSQSCHLIATDGKSHLIEPIALANLLEIPSFVVFDSDAHINEDNEKARERREGHEKDNKTILNLCSYPEEDPMPSDTLWKKNLVMWKSELNKIVDEDINDKEFDEIRNKVRQKYGAPGGIEKNGLFIAEYLTLAWDKKLRSNSLEKLCECIIDFAKSN